MLPAVQGGRTTGLRAGIVGTGFMGSVHARAIRRAGLSLVGVVGSSPERSAFAASELATTAYSDIETLAADVDVVHICTPNHLHAKQATKVIELGRHVVCEKPIATTVADAAAMVDAQHRAGVVGTVPFVYRFHPMVREARSRVADGRLGRLVLAHGGYLQDWLAQPDAGNWRVDALQGGPTRAFGDIGSHWCDLLEFVTGQRITALVAQLVTAHPVRAGQAVETDDVATLSFTTDGGIVGTSVISQVSPGRKNRLSVELAGTEGSLGFDQEIPDQLWLGGVESNGVLLRDPLTNSEAAVRYSVLPAGHPQGYQDCFDNFVRDTALAIGGEEVDGLPVLADGLRAAVLAEAVVASAAKGGWVNVDGTPS